MKRLEKGVERMYQCFFGGIYHCYDKYGDKELSDSSLRQFNFSLGFPEDMKHKFTFGKNTVTVENEYFLMRYENLDPKRERYMTPQTELLIVEVEIYQPVSKLKFVE